MRVNWIQLLIQFNSQITIIANSSNSYTLNFYKIKLFDYLKK